MTNKALVGAALAAAVAVMFAAERGFAANQEGGKTKANVACVGANDCKGQSACKTASNAGPGQNSCKGQGMVFTQSAEQCKDKGGHVAKM